MTLQEICLDTIGKRPNYYDISLLHQELKDLLREVKIEEEIVVRKVDKPFRKDTSEYKTVQTITKERIYKTKTDREIIIYVDGVIIESSWIDGKVHTLWRFEDGKALQVLYKCKGRIQGCLYNKHGIKVCTYYNYIPTNKNELKSGYYTYLLFKNDFDYEKISILL